jgi:hypothetical protein
MTSPWSGVVSAIVKKMDKQGMPTCPVTNSQGILIFADTIPYPGRLT